MKLDTSSYYPKSPLDDPEPEKPEKSEPSEPSEPSGPSGPSESSEPERGITLFANILSWALVPLLMPVYGTLLAFGLSLLAFTPAATRLAFIAIVVAFNVAAPGLVIALLKKLGFISDIGLNGREERLIPYIVCILALVGTALFMHHKGAPQWLVMFYYGGAAAGLVELVVNRWWKISVHAAGAAGIVALLTRMLSLDYVASGIFTWLVIAVALAGLLGSARIWLGRHTLAQVLAGYAVGFCGVYFLI